jgi:hypothetical protein
VKPLVYVADTPITPRNAKRFWTHVDRTGECWLWTASLDGKGYGQFRVGGNRGRMMRAHRVAYLLVMRCIPDLLACHRCDNRQCVRPSHLFFGTDLDNVRDMDAKGRRRTVTARGEAHANAKLTLEQVQAIKDAICGGETQRSIADRFGVSLSTVNHINTGRRWSYAS